MTYTDDEGNLYDVERCPLGWTIREIGEVKYSVEERFHFHALSLTKKEAEKKLKAYAKEFGLQRI